MARLRVGLAQVDVVVGDLPGNVARITDVVREAGSRCCDVVVFPELAVCGYPPEDLLLKPSFVSDNLAALGEVAAATSAPCAAVVGYVDRDDGLLHNAAAVCHDGRVAVRYRKRRLPNYAVFDEQRYFAPGTGGPALFTVAGVPTAVTICEDAWSAGGPVVAAATAGARVVLNLNASPYHVGKHAEREEEIRARVAEAACTVVYVNLVGGQDELIFDGGSFVVDEGARVVHRAPLFTEHLSVVDLEIPVAEDVTAGAPPGAAAGPGAPDAGGAPAPRAETGAAPTAALVVSGASAAAGSPPVAPADAPRPARVPEIFDALVLGTRDYARKNGFDEVVVALSGGIDSTLVAVLAAAALGPQRVNGVLLPSRYSSDHSVTDAEAVADRLGIDRRTIPIEDAHRALLQMLAPSFGEEVPSLAEENLQSRVRGVVVMALSNAFGWLVLTTSNKTESAVGYSTLYGDSAGGFAVIKDVPKLLVYELCREANRRAAEVGREPPVPERVLTKAPSAELRPEQRDDDSLPPYEVLDPIVEAYVEEDRTVADLVAAGHDAATVRRVARLIDGAEYKRRQFPPGPRVTSKAFGKDRRLPITNHYRG